MDQPSPHAPPLAPWDVFCRVIDNHGDLGVCWRLAADLAGRGQPVRLWVDRPQALDWMAPAGAAGVQVLPWRDPRDGEHPGPVVIEAFGCDPPPAFVARMAGARTPPAWINLEYLSAESYVERSHGLPSPQLDGPGRGLTKWFFYPGFTAHTGGLLREPGLARRRAAFDRAALLQRLGVPAPPGARVVLVFCYENPRLPEWLDELAAHAAEFPAGATVLLVPPGPAARQAATWLGTAPQPGTAASRGGLTAQWLPYVPQPQFDELLWSTDLNLVRGEDSLVRALWAGTPFVWHIYPQVDGAHHAKLQAFLDMYLEGADADLAEAVRLLHARWNGLNPNPGLPLLPAAASTGWRTHAEAAAARLARQGDLTSELLHFVRRRQETARG